MTKIERNRNPLFRVAIFPYDGKLYKAMFDGSVPGLSAPPIMVRKATGWEPGQPYPDDYSLTWSVARDAERPIVSYHAQQILALHRYPSRITISKPLPRNKKRHA